MLNLVNYKEFPGDNRYRVFYFNTVEEANVFEQFLKEKNVWYERSTDAEGSKTRYLFGIHKDDFNRAQKANFLTNAQFRKPFMPDKIFRYIVMILAFGTILLGIVGYYLSNR